MTDRFDTLWSSGAWRKFGKQEARRRFQASVKTEDDWRDIQMARDAYNAHCAKESWYTPMLGSVWFGATKGWRNWVPEPEERVEALADDPLVHVHFCSYCGQDGHEWTHEYPNCWLTRDIICDSGLERHKALIERRK